MSVGVTKLPSGLTVVSEDMPGLASTALGVWVNVGARNEAVEENGISHMLEHMAFKGTKSRTARQIAEEVENVGGSLNAYTSREQTAYFARLLGENVPLALDILGDILCHSTFAPDELERERGVILQEIGECHDTPDDLVFDLLQEASFPDQPLGRNILGTTDHVRSFQRQHLQSYMAAHYRAPAMIVAAAGQVDHGALVTWASGLGETLAGDAQTRTQAACYTGGARLVERDLEQVHVSLAFNGVAYDHADYYALQVYSSILGGGMSSRLFQEVREVRGLAYSVYSFNASYKDGGTLGIYAGTSPDQVAELAPVIAGEMHKLTQHVDETELARARAQAKASMVMALERPASRCESFARQMFIFGTVMTPEEIMARIEAVTAEQVQKVARDVLCAGPLSLAAVGPLAQLPAYDQLNDIFRV